LSTSTCSVLPVAEAGIELALPLVFFWPAGAGEKAAASRYLIGTPSSAAVERPRSLTRTTTLDALVGGVQCNCGSSAFTCLRRRGRCGHESRLTYGGDCLRPSWSRAPIRPGHGPILERAGCPWGTTVLGHRGHGRRGFSHGWPGRPHRCRRWTSARRLAKPPAAWGDSTLRLRRTSSVRITVSGRR
jgi:hypothetical protein